MMHIAVMMVGSQGRKKWTKRPGVCIPRRLTDSSSYFGKSISQILFSKIIMFVRFWLKKNQNNKMYAFENQVNNHLMLREGNP